MSIRRPRFVSLTVFAPHIAATRRKSCDRYRRTADQRWELRQSLRPLAQLPSPVFANLIGLDLERALSLIPMLSRLDGDLRTKLSNLVTLRTWSEGNVVFELGEVPTNLYFVVGGAVRLSVPRPSDRETIIHLVRVGECVCPNLIEDRREACCRAIAHHCGTVLLSIPNTLALEHLYPRSEPQRSMMLSMARRGCDSCRRVRELTAGRVEQRLAVALLNRSRLPVQGGPPRLCMRRQDLAQLCSTSVESLIRALTGLRQMALVAVDQSSITLLDTKGLETIARDPLRRRARQCKGTEDLEPPRIECDTAPRAKSTLVSLWSASLRIPPL